MSEWKNVRLGDVCDTVIDYRGKTPLKLGSNWADAGYRALSAKNIKTGKIVQEDSIRYVDEKLYQKWMKDEISRGDIIITSEAPFGEVFYWDSDEKIVLSQRLFGLKLMSNICSKYIFYYMTSYTFQQELKSRATGTTVIGLRQPELLKSEIILPPLAEQERIAAILGSLDDKIELNNRINKNLEEQASALFKRWFVDFEFPDADGNPYKSAGGKFLDSPMGKIPEGWRVGKLSDLICVKYGKDHKKLNDGVIPVYGSGGVMRYVDCVLYDKESVLIPRKGTLNNITYINTPFWSVDTMFYSEMKQPNIAKVIYFFLKEKDMASLNAGSAVPSMTTEILNSMPIIIADEKIYQSYDNVVFEMFSAISNNTKQNERLAQMRDSLLPKLMNNKIKLK